MAKIIFSGRKQFLSSINLEVENYFRNSNLKKTGNAELFFKTIVLCTVAAALYFSLLFLQLPVILQIFSCLMLGFVLALIGFNVMHDANHGSYSEKRWVNSAMGLTANALGANATIWKQKHNIIHHTYTNISGVDDDIGKMPLLRMSPYQRHLDFHKYQFLYCIPLYGLSSILWIFVTDFAKYFGGSIHGTRLKEMSAINHAIFWASKILYIFFYIVLPVVVLGWAPFFAGFFLMHLSMGLTLSLVFQLAHVVENTHMEDAETGDLEIDEEWAVYQVRTTSDFATQSRVVSWLTGGLNFQIEHHLFPKISHVHYPAIHEIVKTACRKYSLEYNSYPTVSSALMSHFRLMKKLGEKVPPLASSASIQQTL